MFVLVVTSDIDRAERAMVEALARSGIKITLICSHEAYDLEAIRNAGVKIHQHEYSGHKDIGLRKMLSKLLAENHLQVIHVLRRISLSNVLAVTKDSKLPIIAYRGVADRGNPLNPFDWRGFLHPRVKRVLCVSDAVRDYFLGQPLSHFFYPESRYITIHKGHDPEWYPTTSREVLRDLCIPDNALVIAIAAAMRTRKGTDLLIEAFDQLPQSYNAHLLLIGEIRDPRIHKAYENAANKAHIHLCGFRKDAKALLGASDIMALPVRRPEGLPRAVVEAMIQGVPAVVSNMPGCTELVNNGENGLVVKTGDVNALYNALDTLLADATLRERLGAAARRTIIDGFHINGTVKKTLDVYRELCLSAKNDIKPEGGAL